MSLDPQVLKNSTKNAGRPIPRILPIAQIYKVRDHVYTSTRQAPGHDTRHCMLPPSAPRLIGGLRVDGLLAVVMRDRLETNGHVDRVRADAWTCARVPCSSWSRRVAARWTATTGVPVRDALRDADNDVGELKDLSKQASEAT